MLSDSFGSTSHLGAQEIMDLFKSAEGEALGLLRLLINEYNYVYLEGTNISENGAYLIHPANWPKSDIESAKKCWPAMESAGLQFVGLQEPTQVIKGQTISHCDGLLDGKNCDLKFLESNSANPYESISAKMKKASKQGAEVVVIAVGKSYSNEELERLNARINGKIASLKYTMLKKVILIK
jgi:hypothetical protein